MNAPSIWRASTSDARIHAIVRQVLSVALTTMKRRANVCQATLATPSSDALPVSIFDESLLKHGTHFPFSHSQFKHNQHHNARWTQTAPANLPVSITCARTHVRRPGHVERTPSARWSIHCHCEQWCAHVSQDLSATPTSDANKVNLIRLRQFDADTIVTNCGSEHLFHAKTMHLKLNRITDPFSADFFPLFSRSRRFNFVIFL